MNRTLWVTLSLGLSSLAYGEDKKTHTLIENGLNAAGFANLGLANGVRSEDLLAPAVQGGWQFVRYQDVSWALGYASVGLGGASSIHGFYTQLGYEFSTYRVQLGFTNGKGYMERTSDQSAVDDRAKISLAVKEFQLGFVYGLSENFGALVELGSRAVSLSPEDEAIEGDTAASFSVFFGVAASQF